MFTPLVITALAALPVSWGAWWLNRKLTTPAETLATGRHHIGAVKSPYRPGQNAARPAADPIVIVIAGPDPLTEEEERARMVPMPVEPPAWRNDATEMLGIAIPPRPADVHPSPCGFPDVVPCICSISPDVWFGVPDDDTRHLEAIQ